MDFDFPSQDLVSVDGKLPSDPNKLSQKLRVRHHPYLLGVDISSISFARMESAAPGTNVAYFDRFPETFLTGFSMPVVFRYETSHLPPFSFEDKFDIYFQGSKGVCSLPLTIDGCISAEAQG